MGKRPLFLFCLLFVFTRIGLILMGGESSPPINVKAEQDQTIQVTGQVYRKEIKEKYQILYLKNNSISKSNLLLYDETFRNITIGNTIFVKGEWQEFEPAGNPGCFDAQKYYSRKNICGSMWAEKIQVSDGDTSVLREGLFQMQYSLRQWFVEVLGEENGGVLSAMLLGDKNQLPSEIKNQYQKNGISHVLAISGLHISLIGLGLYKGIQRLNGSVYLAGITGVLVLVLYGMMIGCPVSAVRAIIMFAIRVGADLVGRVYDGLTALAVAAAVIVIWQPYIVFDAGFLLSFGAILGIYLFVPLFPDYIFWKMFAVSIGVQLATFPIAIYFFFETAPYAMVLNLFVIPAAGWIMGSGIAAVVVRGVSIRLGSLILRMPGLVLEVVELLCHRMERIPGWRVVLGRPEWWEILIYYLGVLVLYIMLIKKRNKGLVVGSLLVVLSIFFFVCHPQKGVSVTMLDVGQGDGIVICGPSGKNYLVDGGSSDQKNVGKYVLEPYLKSQGIGTLDYVFVSHGDGDHTNGIVELLERGEYGVAIENLVMPPQKVWDEELYQVYNVATEAGVRVLTMRSGELLEENDFMLQCLQPGEAFEGKTGNEASMVLRLSYGNFSMLLTGDVEGNGEEELVDNLDVGTVTVLKVAHHGSKNSTSKEFLEKVRPKIALISVGENNRYGHPHKETLERLAGCGSRIYKTEDTGAVTIKSDGKRMEVETFCE